MKTTTSSKHYSRVALLQGIVAVAASLLCADAFGYNCLAEATWKKGPTEWPLSATDKENCDDLIPLTTGGELQRNRSAAEKTTHVHSAV